MGRRIIFREQGRVTLEDFSPSAPGPDDVLVRTLASLISIGTETAVLHRKYDDNTHFSQMFSFPQMQTGNQSIGIVERCGGDVTNLHPGERVFIRKAHASHWTVPASECAPAPKEMDISSAIWCGFAKIAFRAAEAAPFRLGGETLIVGAGPVGQMAARWALATGMGRVVLCDLSSHRLSLAPEGVIACEGSINDRSQDLLSLCEGDGFESVVDSTGNPNAFQAALSLTVPLGKVVLLGDTGYPSRQCLTSDVMIKGLSIVGAHEQLDRGGLTQPEIDALFFTLATRQSFDPKGLITHVFPPDRYEEAYALASDRRDEAVGVMFTWSDD